MEQSEQSTDSNLLAELGSTVYHAHSEHNAQLQHRLDLLKAWFGSNDEASRALRNRTVVEIGCGQGDMTVPLAYMVSGSGKVFGVDPGPLDYGAPVTLGQAQDHISNSKVGKCIEWVQQDPMDFFGQYSEPDYIVCAHSLFYLPSEEYFRSLLRKLATAASQDANRPTKLLLADWAMQISTPAAKAHILAVQAQMACPVPQGNIRTVLSPEQMKSLAQEAGWQLLKEDCIRQPGLSDGRWEVGNARLILKQETVNDDAKLLLEQMEHEAKQCPNGVKCMDVWTSVWTKAE